MPKKKLQRFAELDTLANVAQISQNDIKKKLQGFLTEKPLILELGCGRGEYTISLAKQYPEKQFIGVDIQGERLWFGAKYALEKKLKNVMFLRLQVENLAEYFENNSITEIWITFPDPFPRKRQIKKRLTSPRFLELYQQTLEKDGSVHLKTDDFNLFTYSQESVKDFGEQILEKIDNNHSDNHKGLHLDTKTYYEKIHLQGGKAIYYLKFSLK